MDGDEQTTERPVWLPWEIFQSESRYLTVAGSRVHDVDEGSGDVILFVHGNPDYSLLYRHQVEELRSDHQCVAIDLVGFGLP